MATHSWRFALFVVGCAALTLFLANGTRLGFSVFLKPMTMEFGWSREMFGFTIALQNIVWGLSQPFVGGIADRFGAAKVVVSGALIYVLGLYLMAQAETPVDLAISGGVLIGLALSGTSFPVILAVVGRSVPPARRTFFLGIAAIGGSAGQLVLVPASQSLISGFGVREALLTLSMLALLMVPLGLALSGRRASVFSKSRPQQRVGEALSEALHHRGFWLLSAGFFVCGFQLMFVVTHLPAYVVDHGLSPTLGGLAIALIGLGNIVGTLAAGYLGDRYRPKYVLSWLYLIRAVLIAAFLSVPISDVSLLLFSLCLGLVWLGTVPLTNSVVGQMFGVDYLAMLFGIVFVSHQLGSFLGAWYGGYSFDAFGTYGPAWWVSIGLGVVAAILHWPIDDRAVSRLAVSKAS